MYCSNCGAEIVNNHKFCINCGRPVQVINQEIKDEKIIEYKEEKKLEPLKDNSFVVPLVFGILLASILTIVCVASFNKETTNTMQKRICQVDKKW